ncbi:aminotransferase class V-fold PLP-dependent enzyme, partial [Pectobacterium carotovorum subsp. carotovorum]|nr:aminotransferase class V-fold PLP-dependent enzyme [Pectobacterium carotovorum subsp. carotovorum]
MDAFSLQPSAGAHGEFTALLVIRAYHEKRGDHARNKILVPDSAHGTNPASAAMVGCEIINIPSDKDGNVDIEELKKTVGNDTAALMLTNPNTLGLFETHIKEIAEIVHKAGGLLYYDGANLNAIMGRLRPGDMGYDIVHLNLHKTFSTPHGGGGPGSGPIGCKKFLEEFLPVPVVTGSDGSYKLDYNRPDSIGRVRNF